MIALHLNSDGKVVAGLTVLHDAITGLDYEVVSVAAGALPTPEHPTGQVFWPSSTAAQCQAMGHIQCRELAKRRREIARMARRHKAVLDLIP